MVWTCSAYPCLKPRGQQLTKMERKKIIIICPSFSAVTNINSWRVKSALSNVVSLVRRLPFKGPVPVFRDIYLFPNPKTNISCCNHLIIRFTYCKIWLSCTALPKFKMAFGNSCTQIQGSSQPQLHIFKTYTKSSDSQYSCIQLKIEDVKQ